MNKKNVALILGLMVTIAPVCCADEVQAPAQATAQECCTEVCEVVPTEQIPAESTPVESVEQPVSPCAEATEDKAPLADATEVNPEQELTEEQLKELLDQIIAEVKKEEEAKKKKDATAQADVQQAPVAE